MRARTLWSRALTLAITTLVACELPTRPPASTDAVADVAVSPKVVTVQQYQAVDFTAIGFTSTGDTADAAISWSVTSGAITDTTTSNGKHYGRYKAGSDTGKAHIVAKGNGNGGGSSDTAVVTVTPATVATVAVSPATASLVVGQSVQLVASPQDVDGNALSGRVVTYASTNPGVATVNASGVVSAVAAGAATVMVACEGQSTPVAITVAVVPVASVSVSPSSMNLTVGQTAQLTATPKDASGSPLTGRTVTWSTSNAAVAGVSGNGLVTGAAAGTATITASSEGRNGTAAITVTVVPVASVSVSPATATVLSGQTVQLTAIPKDANGSALTGRVVTWASSVPAVATVSASGLVTGVAAGTITITATSEGKNGTASVTVTVVPVASVSVTPATPSVQVGQNVQLTATPRDANGTALTGRVVTWATSDAAVATVNGSGRVTGVAAGSATITATSEGQSGTATVTVTAPVANPAAVTNLSVASVTQNSVTLSFTEVTNGAGQPASYDVRWAAGTMAWASGTEVSQGTCTTPVAGTAIGATRSCTVLGLASGTAHQFQLVAFRGTLNVDAVFGSLSNVASGTTTNSTAPVASVTLSPASVNLLVGGTQQVTAILKDASGNILTGRTVTWTSSAPLLASVSGNGLVSALLAGVATITATSEGISNTAGVTITTGGGGSSHEPAGFRPFNDQPWSLLTGNSWNYLRRTSSKDAGIVIDLSAPRSPADVLRIVFTTDMIHDTEPTVHWIALPGVREIYTVWWVKVSPNWQCSPAGCGKLTFLFTNGAGQVYTNLYNSASGQGAPYRVGVNTEWAPYGQRVWMPNATTTPINPGEWHKIEVYYKWSTTGTADGTVRWWVDGVLNGDYTNVQYPSGSFVEFQFAPTLQNPPSAEQYMYVDHTYVSVP